MPTFVPIALENVRQTRSDSAVAERAKWADSLLAAMLADQSKGQSVTMEKDDMPINWQASIKEQAKKLTPPREVSFTTLETRTRKGGKQNATEIKEARVFACAFVPLVAAPAPEAPATETPATTPDVEASATPEVTPEVTPVTPVTPATTGKK